MTAGRPQKVPRKYVPLWVQVQPAVVVALEEYARDLAARVTPGLNVTRQDAARGVFNAWLATWRATRRKPRRTAP